jgi:hypothetical protein
VAAVVDQELLDPLEALADAVVVVMVVPSQAAQEHPTLVVVVDQEDLQLASGLLAVLVVLV